MDVVRLDIYCGSELIHMNMLPPMKFTILNIELCAKLSFEFFRRNMKTMLTLSDIRDNWTIEKIERTDEKKKIMQKGRILVDAD